MAGAECAGHNHHWGDKMLNCVIVGLGGFAGSVLRYLAGKLPLGAASGFPVNTLIINVLGSFVIGILAALGSKYSYFDPRLMLLLKVGLCGGFTTFSTFSLETFELIRAGSYGTAAGYAVLSAVLGVLAVLLAHVLVRA